MYLQPAVSTTIAPNRLASAPCLHRSGQLDVRLATSDEELAAAQALRYRIFYGEMGAKPSPQMAALGRDIDPYDSICDHLLVIDHSCEDRPQVVGTYRLLRQDVAERNHGFYSAQEFDLGPLLAQRQGQGQLLELGRSCVAPAHRNNGTIALLWRGIASYIERHRIGFLMGCASLPGTCADVHAAELSYLRHFHLAPPELRARAWPEYHIPMDRLQAVNYDPKLAFRGLPPLLKGYLRVGAMVGDGAFIDHQFNTVDVFVVMPVDRITQRYAERFRSDVEAAG